MRMYGKPPFALVVLASVTFMGVPSGSSLAARLPQVHRPNGARSFAGSTTGQRGSLDPSFGNAGKVVTVTPGGNGQCFQKAALQPAGKIVAADCVSQGVRLVRYLPSGSLDPSFGKGGIDIIGLQNANLNAVTSQPDGKLLVAVALTSTTSGIARINSNGTVDATFGKSGIATVQSPISVGLGHSVIVLSDGRIVVDALKFGDQFGRGSAFGLARFLPNGTLDSTFGKNGFALINGIGQVGALAVAQDGTLDELIDMGSGLPPAYAVHFSANGGFIAPPPSGNLAVIASTSSPMAFQPDAKIVFAPGSEGGRNAADNGRLTSFNSIDPSFQTPLYSFFSGNRAIFGGNVITVEPNGGILIAGAGGPFDSEFGLGRFNLDGSLDTGFGSGGFVGTAFFTGSGASASIAALLVQSDGKIVAVGNTVSNSTGANAIALARYFGP